MQSTQIDNSITVITLSVHGKPVQFTFCEHPSAEYMETARKAAEAVEDDARTPTSSRRNYKMRPAPVFELGQSVTTKRDGKGRVLSESYGIARVELSLGTVRDYTVTSLKT